jgi:hypothetical protein
MMSENVWFDQAKYEKAEAQYQELLAQTKCGATNSPAAPAAAAPTVAPAAAAPKTEVCTGSSFLEILEKSPRS